MDLTLLRLINRGLAAPLLDIFMMGLTLYSLGLLPGLGAALAMGRQRRVGVAIGVALAVGLVLTLLFQFFGLRPRPDGVRLILPMPPFPSYPSGHAVAAFATATVVALSYRRPRWVGLALLGATLISLSRVYLGHHYPSDVVGGAILGAGTGAACYGLLVTRASGAARWRWLLWPQVALVFLGTQMAYLGIIPWQLLRWSLADKVLHFLFFGMTVFWLTLWLEPRAFRWRGLALPLSILLPLTIALLEEGAQHFSPLRTASLTDLASDAAGMLCFWWLSRRLFAGQKAPSLE